MGSELASSPMKFAPRDGVAYFERFGFAAKNIHPLFREAIRLRRVPWWMRLFSFVLAHHGARTLGPIALGFRRTFWSKGEVFEMRLPNRGFYYELDPPLPVETLEGRVRGVRQKPFLGYMRKPGVKYSSERPPSLAETPESKAGGLEAP